jgi:hypothetical protein
MTLAYRRLVDVAQDVIERDQLGAIPGLLHGCPAGALNQPAADLIGPVVVQWSKAAVDQQAGLLRHAAGIDQRVGDGVFVEARRFKASSRTLRTCRRC